MGVGLVVLQAPASVSSVAMCLSSAPTAYKIHKARATGDAALLPLVALLVNCHMLVLYGLVTGDLFPLFATYLVGEVLAAIYTAVYLRYTTTRRYAARSLAAALGFVAAASLFVALAKAGATALTSDQLKAAAGYLMGVGSVLLYVLPLETVARVLKTRSGASIPVGMCLAGAVCALLAAAQVALYLAFYPSQPSRRVAHDQLQVQVNIGDAIGDCIAIDKAATKLALHPSMNACGSPMAEYVRATTLVGDQ